MVDQHRPILIIIFVFFAFQGINRPSDINAEPISIQYRDEPLAAVIEKISAHSGYEVVIDGVHRDTPISGDVQNLSLEETLRKILKRFNHTIIWNEKEKKIIISVYDGSPDASTGDRNSTASETVEPIPSNSFSIQPSDEFGAFIQPTGRRDTMISGEGRRFIEGTRTTGE